MTAIHTTHLWGFGVLPLLSDLLCSFSMVGTSKPPNRHCLVNGKYIYLFYPVERVTPNNKQCAILSTETIRPTDINIQLFMQQPLIPDIPPY